MAPLTINGTAGHPEGTSSTEGTMQSRRSLYVLSTTLRMASPTPEDAMALGCKVDASAAELDSGDEANLTT
jgi:hypothetical protein